MNYGKVSLIKNPSGPISTRLIEGDAPDVMFLLLLSGEMKCRTNDVWHYVSPRSLILFSDMQVLPELILKEGSKGYLLSLSKLMSDSLHFDFINSESLGKHVPVLPCTLNKRDADVYRLYFETMLDCLQNNDSYGDESLWLLIKAFSYKVSKLFEGMRKREFNAYDRKEQIVRDFINLIQKNGGMRRDLDYYAQELCISSKYLSHVVSKATGKKCLAWIEEYAIDRACTVLKTTDLSISQISFMLNYSSPSDFCRYFRNRTGMSPKSFRDSKENAILNHAARKK